MTPITELKQILNKELFESKAPSFNHTEALNELKLADQAKSLGEQFKSLLKVVNRCQDPTDKEIKQGLLNHEQVLRLIKTIDKEIKQGLLNHEQVLTINRPANKNLQEAYDLAVTEFNNKN